MAQIFHRSANSLAKVSIVAALLMLGGVLWAAYRIERRLIHHRRGRGSRSAGSLSATNTTSATTASTAATATPRWRRPLSPDSAHRNLHELPLADLDQRGDAGAGARKLPHREVARVDARSRSARFRLLQSQHSCEQGNRLLHVPRPRGPDAADVQGKHALHAVVRRMPPQSGEEMSGRGIRYSIMAYETPRRTRTKSGRRLVAEYKIQSLTDCVTCHR